MSEDSQWDKVAASIDHLIKRLLKNITLCMKTLLQPLNDQGLPWSFLGAEHLVKGFQGALQIKTHACLNNQVIYPLQPLTPPYPFQPSQFNTQE